MIGLASSTSGGLDELLLGLLILVVAGLAAGFISGLMGVGGGIVMTPVLHYALDRSWGEAVALSLLVIAIQSPVGVWRHRKRGAVDMRLALPLILGGAGGVALGIWLEPRIGVPVLKLAFAALMVIAGHRLVSGSKVKQGRPRTGALAFVGFGAGVISRLLGVGGGIVTVPALALMGIGAHIAVGTSLVPVWTNAAVASGVNLWVGLAWLHAVPLALGAVAAAPWGVKAAHALPERGLRTVVAAGLVLVATLVAFDAWDHL